MAEAASARLVEKFSDASGESPPSARTRRTGGHAAAADDDRDDAPDPRVRVAGEPDEAGRLRVRVDGTTHHLPQAVAARLRDELASALVRRESFLYTAGERRPDGTYAVVRRGADSAGHAKVFASPDPLRDLYEDLPREFAAPDVGRPGLTDGRRHLVLRHLCEHPAFDCELVRRQPLVARKSVEGEGDGTGDDAP